MLVHRLQFEYEWKCISEQVSSKSTDLDIQMIENSGYKVYMAKIAADSEPGSLLTLVVKYKPRFLKK